MAKEHRSSDLDNAENGYVQQPDKPTPAAAPSRFAVKSPLLRECLAEFIGTAILIAFGDGVVAQVVLSGAKQDPRGDYTHINLCWGLAVLFGIHFSGGVSGAHLNPAVSTTLALFKRFEWRKVPFYVLAQVLGAFFGAFIVYIVYYVHLKDLPTSDTKGIFATYPYGGVTTGSAFVTEVVGTALLMSGIFAIGDQLNKPASPYSAPGAVALLVVAIGMAFGMNSGYAINPARDFGPRLFTAVAGWGSEVFTAGENYFWVPIVAPLIGGALGGAMYLGFVEIHHPRQE